MPISHARYTAEKIANDIEHEIVAKSLAHGVQLPNGAQYAERYQVSAKTVERAMGKLQKKGLISRIRRKGTFVRSNTPCFARDRIGIFRFFLEKSYVMCASAAFSAFNFMEQTLCDRLSAMNFQAELIDTNKLFTDHIGAVQLPETLFAKYDTIILPAGIVLENRDFFLRMKKKIILVFDDRVHSGPWHQVIYDYTPGFLQAIKFFRDHHLKKLFVAAIDDHETSQRRADTFAACARKSGYADSDIVIRRAAPNAFSHFPEGQECAEYYIENKLFDHAIFSTSDFISYGMYDVFSKNSLVPGRDFKFISYDNLQGMTADPAYHLGMSGVTHPQQQAIEAIVKLSAALTSHSTDSGFYCTYFVPATELILRSST